MADSSNSAFKNANWIWPKVQGDELNQYIEFRHEFVMDSVSAEAVLKISVDTNYAAYLNGQFVGTGQFSDYPDRKTFSALEIARHLRKGRNVLAVPAWYCGKSHMSYIKGPPRLIYVLKVGGGELCSGKDTCWRLSPAYRQGIMPCLTPQLPFTFEYNALGEDKWKSPEYIPDNGWKNITDADITARSAVPTARPLPHLQIKPRLKAHIVAQGYFIRRQGRGDASVAELMQSDFLSHRNADLVFEGLPGVIETHHVAPVPLERALKFKTYSPGTDGVYAVIDIGREEAGFLEIELDADAGTVVDIAYGEHLDDLRVRSHSGPRHFACRYRCREGRQVFTHRMVRFAGRYVQLHISGFSDTLTLYYAGIVPAEYPVLVRGKFESPDALQNRIYEVGVRTLHLCMHEHYEDTPWREQGLYANDARNQALSGYYCFGEYELPKVSFSLLADSLRDDGYVTICAPSDWPRTIPSFTMAWIIEVAEYLLYSGDMQFASEMLSAVTRVLDARLSETVDGLLPTPFGKQYWHFYDWADGLSGEDGNGQRFDAPLNAFFCMALDAAAFLARHCCRDEQAKNYAAAAGQLRTAFNRTFRDDQAGAYRTYAGDKITEHFAELTQALALCARIPEPEQANVLRRKLIASDGKLIETSLSQAIYKFEALMGDDKECAQGVFDKIKADWGDMLFQGATSFWECREGGWFCNAGSLSHGWSAIPVYFYGAYLLGVKPTSPGFKTFSVKPATSAAGEISGIVPTPHGPITLSWRRGESSIHYELTCPKGLSPEFPEASDNDKIEINYIN